MTNFSSRQVEEVSKFLQDYMNKMAFAQLTADECAELLAENDILPNDVGPKPGFNFRQMLRDGRDGLIPLVTGAFQEAPNKHWQINRKESH